MNLVTLRVREGQVYPGPISSGGQADGIVSANHITAAESLLSNQLRRFWWAYSLSRGVACANETLSWVFLDSVRADEVGVLLYHVVNEHVSQVVFHGAFVDTRVVRNPLQQLVSSPATGLVKDIKDLFLNRVDFSVPVAHGRLLGPSRFKLSVRNWCCLPDVVTGPLRQ